MIKLYSYSIIASFYLILGLFVMLFPQKALEFIKLIKEKKWFFAIGIIEILLSFLILYFRHETKIPLLITVAGIMLFIDGILYLLGTKILNETFDTLMEMETKTIRYYSLIFLIYSIIIFVGLI